LVGVFVGFIVGDFVGFIVGALDGVMVGDLVGLIVGALVGTAVGDLVVADGTKANSSIPTPSPPRAPGQVGAITILLNGDCSMKPKYATAALLWFTKGNDKLQVCVLPAKHLMERGPEQKSPRSVK
jgi:hypothetical protein